MKKFYSILFVVAAIALALPCAAQPVPELGWSKTSTDIGATNSHAIVTANGAGAPQVRFLNATSDKAGSFVIFYLPTATTAITTASAGGSTNFTCVGSSFAADDIIVLRRVPGDTYERLLCGTAGATNITTTSTNVTAMAVGDLIYKMTPGSKVAIGNATVTVTGNCLTGNRGQPILAEIDGTSACQINAISGGFTKD